ncbi:hypothetical protein LTS18_014227 [Coniosporium uncinatum]|uniref:Uncharacterized protein n=1 Tax=Coniosporium uncinatum TaxID=93489 RepID=A0ACC3DH29_9PEZI|nr:hypothetical protein LTS18_014227 [Coniosporium uncinatum]
MAPSKPDHIAYDLLSRAHPPDATDRIFKDKVLNKPLLLRPTDHQPDARARRQRARKQNADALRKARKPKPLSAKEKRELRVHELQPEEKKYAIYEGLHAMWLSYIKEVLGFGGPADEGKEGWRKTYITAQDAGPLVASAEFVGAAVEVVRSRCVDRVGIKGIVVREHKNSVVVITMGDKVKNIPKEHTVFKTEIPLLDAEKDAEKSLSLELYGDQLISRSADRSKKQVKMHIPPDI